MSKLENDIKLEESFKIKEKKNFKVFKRKFSKIMTATCNGIPWIGDKISQNRTFDGTFNKNILKSNLMIFLQKDLYIKIFLSDLSKIWIS